MKAEDWIKVTDRLPEAKYRTDIEAGYTDFVLVRYKHQYEYIGLISYNEVACYDYEEKGWFKHDDEPIDGEVTHWMPIELPEEGK